MVLGFDAQRMRAKRLERGLSAEKLARQADISVRHVLRLEAGDRPRTSAVTVARLALALGTTVEFLLGATDDPRSLQEILSKQSL